MIRIVIGLFVFAVVLCAWIVIGPTRGSDGAEVAEAPQAEVDRLAAGAEVAAIEAAVAEAVEVTRDQPAEVDTFQPALRNVTRVIAAGPSIRTDDTTLDETTSAVLAGLGLNSGAPVPEPTDEMGQMTSGILSGIRAVTGESL